MGDERRINENRSANMEIENFAKIVLGEDVFLQATNISNDLFSIEEKIEQKAINYLLNLVPSKPKRPFYYVCGELKEGNGMITREVVFGLGAFLNKQIDSVCKEYNIFKRFLSFGRSLRLLKTEINLDIINYEFYNKLFNNKAKHDFDEENYDGNDHLFSVKDVVYCCFVTMKLSEELKKYLKEPVDFLKVDMV